MKMATQPRHFLSLDDINPNLIAMKYMVRGPLTARAGELEKELKKGIKKPFTEVIKGDIGDCHALGQIPITFIRQVLALVTYPPLLDSSRFPEDAKERAQTILSGCKGGSVGSYSETSGIEIIRRHIAEYIQRRDGGISCDWQNIMLSAGASEGIRKVLRLFINSPNGRKAGVMISLPQYSLYSITLTEFGLQQIGYYLDESQNWGISTDELQRAIDEARKVCDPKALVVINPGNPTGQVLSTENIEEVIRFAYKERLYILADEVYQENVYAEGTEFHSFKKVLMEMGEPYNKVELASFMSCSKGYMGECGLRGGYTEIVNMCPKVTEMYLKANSSTLCPPILGQACLDIVMRPPKKEEPSYEQFIKEKKAVLDSLKLRAKMVIEGFNSIEGYSCNDVQGALYAFPQLRLPSKAVEAAKKVNLDPDEFYAFELLEKTGVCVIPGSGFGQKSGTFHIRTTILPQVPKIKLMLEKISKFHTEFLDKYK